MSALLDAARELQARVDVELQRVEDARCEAKRLRDEAEELHATVLRERAVIEQGRADRATSSSATKPMDDIVLINSGGTTFRARRSTLCHIEDSVLARMFSGRWDSGLDYDEQGAAFLDVTPEVFEAVLSHLRALSFDPFAQTPQVPANLQTEVDAFRKFMMLEDALLHAAANAPKYTVAGVGLLKCPSPSAELPSSRRGSVGAAWQRATLADVQRILLQEPPVGLTEPNQALHCCGLVGEDCTISLRLRTCRVVSGAKVMVTAPNGCVWAVKIGKNVMYYDRLYTRESGGFDAGNFEERTLSFQPTETDTVRILVGDPDDDNECCYFYGLSLI